MAFVEFFNRPFPLTESVALWVFCLLVLLVAGVTEGLKIPIKLLTKKIEDEKVRHRVNMVIIALPIALGILVFYIISLIGYNLSTKAIVYDGAYCGNSAVVLYEVLSRVISIVIKKRKGGDKVTLGDVFDAITNGVAQGAENGTQALKATADIADEVGADEIAGQLTNISDIVGNIIDKYIKPSEETDDQE